MVVVIEVSFLSCLIAYLAVYHENSISWILDLIWDTTACLLGGVHAYSKEVKREVANNVGNIIGLCLFFALFTMPSILEKMQKLIH